MYQDLFRLQEEVFKVLANQKRLEIIQLLRGRQLPVNEMAQMLGLRQANLSQHLGLLRQHRVVETRRRGRRIYYSLSDESIGEAAGMIREFLKSQYQVSDNDLAKLDESESQMYPVVEDPVCGMRLSARDAAAKYSHEGQIYHFCALGCFEEFKSASGQYLPSVQTEKTRQVSS